MTYVTTGLTNGGLTAHYQITYDDSLSAADGVDRANALIAVCEQDYDLMGGWFGGIALTFASPMAVQITPGDYARASWGPPIKLVPGNGSGLDVVRYLLVSEVVEMFMLAQNAGWFGAGNEGSAGEGLSRFLAGQFLIANGLGVTEPGFALANKWMNSPRNDYVNNVDVTDHGIDAKTGCAILFIYYLHSQLGYSISSIVASAAPELSAVYRNLRGTGDDPFPVFKQLLEDNFPGTTTIPGANPDNPFPLAGSHKAQGLAEYNGTLYAMWKGEPGDDRLFYARFDGSTWGAQAQVPGVASSVGPALAEFDGVLYAAWKGMDGDQGIWWATFDGLSWSPQQQIANVAGSIGPSLAVFAGALYAAWKGEFAGQGIWWSRFDGSTWTAQQEIANVATSAGPSLAVFDGALYAAWKGEFADQGIWWSRFDGSTWTAQQEIPNVASSIGPSLAGFNGFLYAAWKGEFADQGLYWSRFDGSTWSAQQRIPGNSSVGPALAVYGSTLYALWKGEVNDWRLFYSSLHDGSWAAQQVIAGNSGPDWEAQPV